MSYKCVTGGARVLIRQANETGLREIMTIDKIDFARHQPPEGDALTLP